MLSFAEIKRKMNSLKFSLTLLLLVHHNFSFGRCDDITFSICWMGDALERHNGNIWLNDMALKPLGKVGKVTSLTVFPAVENKLKLQYGRTVQTWTFEITPRTKFAKIRGRQKPLKEPTGDTKAFMNLMSSVEVFACENGTLFFHQHKDFFFAFGHTVRLPFKLKSRSPSMLLVAWVKLDPPVSDGHTVTLYQSELNSYNILSMDTTTNSHYRFTALDSCSPYVACVETAATHSFTCLAAVTDPGPPLDFEVTSWNSSSISLAWECPDNRKFSLFLLTAFYRNGTDHVTQEVALWHRAKDLMWTWSDLEPCSRVEFGLQTVCLEGNGSRYSTMVFNDGNSVQSSIQALHQTYFGPDNYTLSWDVRNTSSISTFRVYHEGALQGTTLTTSYTVDGLLPCQPYRARVEALCGESVLMSSKTVQTHTVPRGVSELRYRSKSSTALWTASLPNQPGLAFQYELSVEKGPTLQRGRVTDTQLPLPMLEPGKTYVLDVWEECDGGWESEHTHLCIQGPNSSMELLMRAGGSSWDPELEMNILTMVVPWSLPEDLEDDGSEPRAKMESIFKDKLLELLKVFDPPARIELATIQTTEEPDQTKILFMTFDASETEEDIPLPAVDVLDHIRSLNTENITVTDGVIYWDGPDLCAYSQLTVCPPNSLCINTLGSYTCVCQHGYYDVSSVVKTPATSQPVCNEKGIFSQCLEKVQTGGIAKPYLASYMRGKVEVKLNDGRCSVDENQLFYYFNTSRKASECGTERRVNTTYIEFQNSLSVTLSREHTISRHHLKVVWKCVYPRHYVRSTPVSLDTNGSETPVWSVRATPRSKDPFALLSSYTVVELSSSVQLGLTMGLFTDGSYTHSYSGAVSLQPEDSLFFQVALQTNDWFASDVLLQVDSCWATESTNPQDQVKGVLLQDGCAVDNTFQWLSVNGLAQESRFSVGMFSMPQRLPLYIHCMANMCGQEEDCTKSCSGQQRSQRSVRRTDREEGRAVVVSAGPLVVTKREQSGTPSDWAEHMKMISIVAGFIGIVGVTVLLLSASKAIMAYYERLRVQ